MERPRPATVNIKMAGRRLGGRVDVARIILIALALIAFGAEAKEGRNLVVKEGAGKRAGDRQR